MKVTLVDPNLPHQIQITLVDNQLSVTCNCWSVVIDGHKIKHVMGSAATLELAWSAYNDPANHNQDREPFYPKPRRASGR